MIHPKPKPTRITIHRWVIHYGTFIAFDAVLKSKGVAAETQNLANAERKKPDTEG